MNNETLARTVRDDIEKDFKLNYGSLVKNNILHCIDIFETILPDKPRYYLHLDKDLWLFSPGFISRVAGIESAAIREASTLDIYAVSKLEGHIEVDLDNYSPQRPKEYSDNSSITLRFLPDGSNVTVEIKATSYKCQRLAEIVKLISGNIQ